mmetsp:Transcript_23045/g.91381  ORF Transcript_23045/g.91381 Transcript_23045/m.91381 type:complete len:231 (+) Transcript_23045:314-1006(+)
MGRDHVSTSLRASRRLSSVSRLSDAYFITTRPTLTPDDVCFLRCSGCAGNPCITSSIAVRIASDGSALPSLRGLSQSQTATNASNSSNVCCRARCANTRRTTGMSCSFASAGLPSARASLSSRKASFMRPRIAIATLSLSSCVISLRRVRFMRASVSASGPPDASPPSSLLCFAPSDASKASPPAPSAPGSSSRKSCFSAAYSARSSWSSPSVSMNALSSSVASTSPSES